MPRPTIQIEQPGQESFLDVVANLVGIMIILVMVVGTRAQSAMRSVPVESEVLARLDDAAHSAEISATSTAEVVSRLVRQIAEGDQELEYRRKERELALTAVMLQDDELAQRRSALSTDQSRTVALSRDLSLANDELQGLKRSKAAIDNDQAPPNVIEHLPTPMAKTVLGKELHFRLAQGRLSYVPWDELVERLKAEASQKLWKMKDSDVLTESIGPVDGYRMEYVLRRVGYALTTRAGSTMQQRVELDHFTLEPLGEEAQGEPLAQALQSGSRFLHLLSGHRPNATTVTIWVYPECYGSFRQLKQFLFQRGFLTAGRPMPAGELIGGSPRGSRSAAE